MNHRIIIAMIVIASVILCGLSPQICCFAYATEINQPKNQYTNLFLSDFTQSGCQWKLLQSDDSLIAVSIDRLDDRCLYRITLEGIQEGESIVSLGLCETENVVWYCNLELRINKDKQCIILNSDIIPAYGDISHVAINYGVSEHFTREQMDNAITVITNEFHSWSGFYLYDIEYTSDKESREKYVYYSNRSIFQSSPGYGDKEGNVYIDGIVFHTRFRTPFVDDGLTSFENGVIYSEYSWVLLCTEKGIWDIVAIGY